MCVYIYIYIYIYTHTHTHTHIYAFIYLWQLKEKKHIGSTEAGHLPKRPSKLPSHSERSRHSSALKGRAFNRHLMY